MPFRSLPGLAPALGPLLALLAAGCAAAGPSARTPAPEGPPRPLWEFAPTGASGGIVVRDGAVVRALETIAGFGSVPDASGTKLEARRKTISPIIAAEGWARAGLDPAMGGAVFVWPTPERGALLVLPVRDRARFRAAFNLSVSHRAGREVELLGNGYVCAPAAGRYLCALSIDEIDGAAAPHEAALGRAFEKLPAEDHGDVEVYAGPRMREVARFRDAVRPLGLLTGVAAAIRFRADGATARIHVVGEAVSPQALAVGGAPPPAVLAPSAAGAPSVARIHADIVPLIPPTAILEPRLRSELLEQLTGDFEVTTSGSGIAGLSGTALLRDPARVERYVKDRCAETGGTERRYALGKITVSDHGCTGAFIPWLRLLPVNLSSLPLSLTVEGDHLVLLAGDAHTPTPAERSYAGLVEGAGALGALEGAEALVAFTRSPTMGPDVAPGKAWKALIPLLDDGRAALLDAWGEVAARIYQVSLAAHVGPEGGVAVLDVTTFATDPREVRDAYEAALARRTAGDEAGYRGALASIEQRFPGTRAARRAALARAGTPYVGTGAALFMALGRIGQKK